MLSLFRAARLFDGLRTVERPTLLVDGGTVVAVGAEPPAAAEVIDVGGVTLLPGLVDTDQHLCFDGNGTLEEQVVGVDDATIADRSRAAGRRALAGGVTTVRDLGDRDWSSLALRDDPSLPTIVAAGPPITLADGHCWYLGGATALDLPSLIGAVRERSDRGADLVKVMVTGGVLTPTFPPWRSQFTRDHLRTIVDEAHRLGLPVAAHCHGIDGIRDALAVGVDSIEHCTFLGADGRPVADEELIAMLARSQAAISVGFGRVAGAPRPPAIAAVWDDLHATRCLLRELGATIVAGTDAGVSLAKPHDVLPTAFGDFLATGFAPTLALRAMTSVAATVCGVGDRKGRLAPGFDADFIAVSGDPLGAGSHLAVVGVWKAGHRVPRSAARVVRLTAPAVVPAPAPARLPTVARPARCRSSRR